MFFFSISSFTLNWLGSKLLSLITLSSIFNPTQSQLRLDQGPTKKKINEGKGNKQIV